jgi:chemotaxis protein methyltransferase CheR
MGAEHTRLRDTIKRMTGLIIDEDKIYLIETRLADIMKEYGLKAYDEMSVKLEEGRDQTFINKVIEKITTHETRFFRDESIFDALVMQILPEWMDRRGITRTRLGGVRLDMWSAGCSTGQEAYSVAMMIREKLPELAPITKIHGTDISKETVDKATKGIYTKFEVDRGVPEYMLNKYFRKVPEGYQVNDDIRNMTSFAVQNLAKDPFPGTYDIILFRNVAIYFSEEMRKELYNKMKQTVKKDGILILGSAESLSGYMTDYILREYGLARYYELNASLVTIFK